MVNVIADYPALKVVEWDGFHRFRHGDEFVVMMPSVRYGNLPKHFKFGSVFGSAVEYGSDVMEAYNRAIENGHDIHFVYGLATVIHNGPKVKKERIALNYGDVVTFEGKKFELVKSSNQNVRLKPVD